MKRTFHTTAPDRQRGVTVLFVTLVILLVLMVLGITAALLSGTQFKLAANLQFENIAFNVAEGASASARNWLSSTNAATGKLNAADPEFDPATRTGAKLYLYTSAAAVDAITKVPTSATWSSTDSVAVGADSRYIIQKINAVPQIMPNEDLSMGRHASGCVRGDLFRVTAIGTSTKGTTKLIQQIYTIPTIILDSTNC